MEDSPLYLAPSETKGSPISKELSPLAPILDVLSFTVRVFDPPSPFTKVVIVGVPPEPS